MLRAPPTSPSASAHRVADAVTPPLSAANLSAQIRGCTLAYIPGAGHLSNLENPDAFNEAVRGFLASIK